MNACEALLLGDTDALKRLLDNGVDINAEHLGKTPLLSPAGYGHMEVVKVLLPKHNVEVNWKDTTAGQMPLLQTVEKGHLAVVKLLEKDQ
jgi:ankyrin repeat protein